VFDFSQLSQAVIKGDASAVEAFAKQAVDAGAPAQDILDKGLIGGMDIVGSRFRNQEMFIPEVLMSAKALYSGLAVIRPLLGEGASGGLGTVVVGTVRGDVHDIGKNLVALMLEGAGFAVKDLGVDVPPEAFVREVKASSAECVGMSALLTTTMPAMKETIDALKEAGLRDKVKVIVGGAPVTRKFAESIGADGYAADSVSAVDAVKGLLK